MQRRKGNSKSDGKQESIIDSAVEKPLLRLHRTLNIRSYWKAIQRLLSAAMPNHVIGLALQHNPALPMIARWTRPISHDSSQLNLSRVMLSGPRAESVCG